MLMLRIDNKFWNSDSTEYTKQPERQTLCTASMELTQLLRGDKQSWSGNSNQPEQETCFGGVHFTEMTYPFLGLPGSTAACVTSREATARMKSLEDCGAVSRRLRDVWVCNCRDEDWLPSAISCSSLSCT